LDIVEPCNTAQDPSIHRFEAILYNHVSRLLIQHDPTDRQPTNLQLGAELRRDVYLGHAELTRWKGRLRREAEPATAAFYTQTMQVAFEKKTRGQGNHMGAQGRECLIAKAGYYYRSSPPRRRLKSHAYRPGIVWSTKPLKRPTHTKAPFGGKNL